MEVMSGGMVSGIRSSRDKRAGGPSFGSSDVTVWLVGSGFSAWHGGVTLLNGMSNMTNIGVCPIHLWVWQAVIDQVSGPKATGKACWISRETMQNNGPRGEVYRKYYTGMVPCVTNPSGRQWLDLCETCSTG